MTDEEKKQYYEFTKYRKFRASNQLEGIDLPYTLTEYTVLINYLSYLNHQYHTLNQPKVEDTVYDQLYRELVDVEQIHPEWVTQESPTQKVGDSVKGNIPHFKPLLSLSNIFNQNELIRFMSSIAGSAVICEYKIDGLALALTYLNRKLIRAMTRGDGVTGEDVTKCVMGIHTVPKMLPVEYPVDEFEVHGEVYIPKHAFESLNLNLEVYGYKPYANPRNAAAGQLRRIHESKVDLSGCLYFTPYGSDDRLVQLLEIEQYFQLMDYLRLCFDVQTHPVFCEAVEQVQLHYEQLIKIRNDIPFEIDGMVIKVNRFDKRIVLGNTIREPRWATAYKFPAMAVSSTLLDVQWQVGRTGVITPVGQIKPVQLGGAEIEYCTLHNPDEIDRLDLGIGDQVFLERRGDVIPKIVGRVRCDVYCAIPTPEICPSCSTPVKRDDVFIYCPNQKCSARQATLIQHFCSRKCMDIDGVGDVLSVELISGGLVKHYADLFKLTTIDSNFIQQNTSLGEKGVKNLVEAIVKRLQPEFVIFLSSLGINQIGLSTAKLIATVVGSIDEIISRIDHDVDQFRDQLQSVHGLGSVSVDSLIEYFKDDTNREIYSIAQSFGLKVKPVIVNNRPLPLCGQTWVITGSFKALNRDAVTQQLESFGAKVSNSVSSKTTVLLVGENAGSKLKKAEELNVRTMDEDTYLTFINEIEL